jgi:hypothetical protein
MSTKEELIKYYLSYLPGLIPPWSDDPAAGWTTEEIRHLKPLIFTTYYCTEYIYIYTYIYCLLLLLYLLVIFIIVSIIFFGFIIIFIIVFIITIIFYIFVIYYIYIYIYHFFYSIEGERGRSIYHNNVTPMTIHDWFDIHFHLLNVLYRWCQRSPRVQPRAVRAGDISVEDARSRLTMVCCNEARWHGASQLHTVADLAHLWY